MKKPSMFSRDYERKMRKIKIRNRILISIGIIVVAGGVVFFSFGKDFTNSSGYLSNLFNDAKESKQDDASENKIESEIKEEDKNDQDKEKEENLSKDVDLGNGKFIKLNFKNNNGKIEFDNIENNGNNISFDISPQKINSTIVDNDKQSIYLLDTNNSLIDISANTYTSSNGTVFNKEPILQQNKDYVWHKSAKFLNDNTVVYLSQLPWFNKTDKYLWSIDLNTKVHTNLNIQGQDIIIGNLTDKGLEITIDGVLKYLNQNGSLVD